MFQMILIDGDEQAWKQVEKSAICDAGLMTWNSAFEEHMSDKMQLNIKQTVCGQNVELDTSLPYDN